MGGMAVVVAMPTGVFATDDALVAKGHDLAKANCARCHQIELEGESPEAKAPPFWSFTLRGSVDEVQKRLLSLAPPKHSDMPAFEMSHEDARLIGAWVQWVQPEAHGKRLVDANCARCHGVTLEDESTHKQAPPFRNLSMFYPIDALEEAFAEGIETGHPDMPVFRMSETQIKDILAYLKLISNPADALKYE